MLKKIRLIFFVLLCCVSVRGQNLIQGTIRPTGGADEFEVWLRPNFNNSTQYLFQIGMPIAFPASASPQPTGINVTLDAGFIAAFGNNYTVTVNPVATATGGLEKYFNIVLVRSGGGASDAQTWTSGVAFKVLTGTFTYTSGGTNFLAKLVDYQDGGGDGQGNFYVQDGNNNYYVTSNSVGNFYASPGNSEVGGTSSAGYVQLLSTVLPVSLLRFSGVRSAGKNVLEWSTGLEINNKGFEVQRSVDGSSYEVLGFVKSLAMEGNSGFLLDYKFEDTAPVGVRQYYRLRQVDMDGYSKLSAVVVIQRERASVLSFEGVYPNPADGEVTVLLNAPERDALTVVVVDGKGQQVLTKEVMIEAGVNRVAVDVRKLAKGSYWVKVGSKRGGEKLVKGLMKR